VDTHVESHGDVLSDAGSTPAASRLRSRSARASSWQPSECRRSALQSVREGGSFAWASRVHLPSKRAHHQAKSVTPKPHSGEGGRSPRLSANYGMATLDCTQNELTTSERSCSVNDAWFVCGRHGVLCRFWRVWLTRRAITQDSLRTLPIGSSGTTPDNRPTPQSSVPGDCSFACSLLTSAMQLDLKRT